MITCHLDLSSTNKFSTLKCPGIGNFDIFSGDGRYRNKIECSHIPNATIPPGIYWITDRPTGGLRSQARTYIEDLYTGNDRTTWFALFRVDEKIDDETTMSRTKRVNFRLHPSRAGGTSWGCITFKNAPEFMVLRNSLLRTQSTIIPNTNIKAYGIVTVVGYSADKKKCDVN